MQQYRRDIHRSRPFFRRTGVLVALVVSCGVLAAGAGFIALRSTPQQGPAPARPASQPAPKPAAKPVPAPAPAVKTIDVQPVIDAWTAKQAATYGIVVYDPAAKKIIGSNQPDKVFFAASLYKLFVAYLALEDIQAGSMNPDEPLSSGFSRMQCIDKMIRESHSPCGEAMMADMGPASLETRAKAMGIMHTTFRGIQTTPRDTALILQYILEKKHLNTERTSFLRDAMRIQEQKFKNGLAKGAPAAIVDSKVGWNETINYHDVGILTLPDKREYVVSILSQGNGSSRPIADFTSSLYAELVK